MIRPAAPAVQPIDGLARIADRFDHVVLDQYGVLHDGQNLFAGVVDCLERLREAGKRILILSNSGKRAADNAERMRGLGLPRSLYDDIVTSGEATWRGLRERAPAPFDGLGRRCFLIVRGGDRSVVDGTGLELVDDPLAADFMLLGGLDDSAADPVAWRPRLAAAAARRIPLLCANPDGMMFGASGLLPGPGALAAAYDMLGGPVHLIGKPHAAIYARCLQELGRPDPARVLAVGNSLEHDVLGGRRAGMATAFVATGVHAAALAQIRTLPVADAVRRLAPDREHLPDWVLPALAW